MNKIDPDIVIDFLNSLITTDENAVNLLIEHRVGCNEALKNHPSVQVLMENDKSFVGLLGILNGLCGVDENNNGFIAAEVDNDDNKIKRFIRFKDKPINK